MKETIAEKIDRCHESLLSDEPHSFWQGPVGTTTYTTKLGQKNYPTELQLHVRQGDDRVETVVKMKWTEVERLYDRLGQVLAERKKLVRIVKKRRAEAETG